MFASDNSEKARIWRYLLKYDNILISDVVSSLKIKKENVKQYINALILSKHLKVKDDRITLLKRCKHYPFYGNGIVTDVDSGEKFNVYKIYKRSIRRVPSQLDFSVFCKYLSSESEFLASTFYKSLVENPEIDVPERIITQAGRRYLIFLEELGAVLFTGETFRNSKYYVVDSEVLESASKMWWSISESYRMKKKDK